jgi:hypothetical protein
MRRLCALILIAGAAVTPLAAAAQQADPRVARAALDQLDYATAIRVARAALAGRIERADRIEMFDVLGYAYGALDSTRQAVDAFKELIYLSPDHEPDVSTVSPRITSLYASALGQVLVVRKVKLDTASFIAGSGGAALRFQVSRPARVVTRAVGSGADVKVDSSLVSGSAQLAWRALTADGRSLPSGRYRLVITASEGSNEYSTAVVADLIRGTADTLPHVNSLAGYQELPEQVTPEQDFRPLGIIGLFVGAAAAESFVLENPSIGGKERVPVAVVSVVALGIGIVASLAKPDPRPVDINIRYNRLLHDQLAQRNADIALRNETLRRQARLIVRPVAGAQ